MKIEIEIPEWAQKSHIWVMAGQECLAMRYAGEEEIYVKVERCLWQRGEKCGKCCEDCQHYMGEGECKIADNDRFFRCCVDAPKTVHKNTPECAMRFEIQR